MIYKIIAYAAVFSLFAFVALAEPIKVDTELVILIDSSGSVPMPEYISQREIYRNALISDDVIEAIESNFHQKVAITLIEFSGNENTGMPLNAIVFRDIIVSNKREMIGLINLFPEERSQYGDTHTFSAINLALDIIYSNEIQSTQRVINAIVDGEPTDIGLNVKLIERLDQFYDPALTINGMIMQHADHSYNQEMVDKYFRHGGKSRRYTLTDEQMQRMLINNFSIEIY